MGTSDGKGRLLTANSDGLMAEGWRRDSGGGVGCVECRGVRLSRQRMTQASSYRWLELLARSASEYHEGLRVSSTDARQVDRRRLTPHACDRVLVSVYGPYLGAREMVTCTQTSSGGLYLSPYLPPYLHRQHSPKMV